MKVRIINEYKLSGERNVRPRRPLIWNGKLYVIFVYDKRGFFESKIQCLALDTFSLLWEYRHDHVINNLLVTGQETLLVSCMDGHVKSFDPNDGTLLWDFETPQGNIGLLSNEVAGKVIFSRIQSKATSTWCLDTSEGNIEWVQPNPGHSYTPVIRNNRVYNCIENYLLCLNLDDGSTVWQQHESRTYLLNPHLWGDLVIASGHGVLNFYDAATGTLYRSVETGQESAIYRPISDQHHLYFGDETGSFYCYRLEGSQTDLRVDLLWSVDTGGVIDSFPVLHKNAVLLINNNKKFVALDKQTGERVLEKSIKGEGQYSGITIYENKLYFSCGGGYVCGWELTDSFS